MSDLSTQILPGLILRDPFMIASSHWTSTEEAYRKLATVRPSAVTLKTTSISRGGDGSEAVGRKRVMHYLIDSFGGRFARYADGPATVEFWDLSTTFRMTAAAREHLTGSVLGLSVLQNEPYSEVAEGLDLGLYGYVELNLKYTFRELSFPALSAEIDRIRTDFLVFRNVFRALPILVKIPREALRLWPLPEVQKLFCDFSSEGTALIIANSLKTRVPPSRVDSEQPQELTKGIIVGEQLFLDTFDSVRRIALAIPDAAIVASGGIMDIGSVVDVFAAGAHAVQLCTALDVRGLQAVQWIRDQFGRLCDKGSSREFATALRSGGDNWSRAVSTSRRLEIQDERRVDLILTEEVLREPLAAALQIECSHAPIGEEPSWELSNPYRFAITKGNVSAFLLGRRARRRLRLTPIECHTTRAFASSLSKAGFAYDFAILPRSVISYLRRQDASGWEGNIPEEVGVVARSRVELVGEMNRGLKGISCVYHFNGASARQAFSQLVREIKPTEVSLTPANLQPIFRLWRADAGILAKPPLSRLYRLLCEKEVAECWGPIWHSEEELVLVASRETLRAPHGGDDAGRLLKCLLHEVAMIAGDCDSATLDLIDFGFLEYSKRLLLGTQAR